MLTDESVASAFNESNVESISIYGIVNAFLFDLVCWECLNILHRICQNEGNNRNAKV